MHQSEVEQVGPTSNIPQLLVKALADREPLVSPPSEDGVQLPCLHHDEGPSGGGGTGSQSAPKSSSQAYFHVPHPAGGQGGGRTPAVSVTSQTREGTNAHTSQVSRAQRGTGAPGTAPLSLCSSPFRLASGPDILPPWKQGGHVTESTHTSITSIASVISSSSSSSIQLGQKQQVRACAAPPAGGGSLGSVPPAVLVHCPTSEPL